MTYTKHILKRMSQRGISSNMVLLTLKYGRVDKDKFVLDRKSLKSLIKETEETRRDLLKLLDKGGVMIVSDRDNLITAYNKNSFRRR